MTIYLVSRIRIENADIETIDEIADNVNTSTDAFTSMKEAQKHLTDLYEYDKFDLNEFLDNEGYCDDIKKDNYYNLTVWDEFGQGISIRGSIQPVELHQ